jgi:hypothetical protein
VSEFGNYSGKTIEFSKILIHLNALKVTPTIANTSSWGAGGEPVKLAFSTQMTYSVNQVSIQFQAQKLMQEEKQLQYASTKT